VKLEVTNAIVDFKSKVFEVEFNKWMKLSVNMGDITEERVDAITNAANEYLCIYAGILITFSPWRRCSRSHYERWRIVCYNINLLKNF
jgi:hypothetical protein